MGPSRGALVQLVCLGDLPSKLNGVVHVLAVPRAIIEVRCTPPEYDCGAHSTAVTDVHAVLEHWSDVVSDAVGELRHARRHQLSKTNRLSRLGHEPNEGTSADLFEPPRLSPMIVTDVLALTARFARSQLLTLTTGAERSKTKLSRT